MSLNIISIYFGLYFVLITVILCFFIFVTIIFYLDLLLFFFYFLSIRSSYSVNGIKHLLREWAHKVQEDLNNMRSRRASKSMPSKLRRNSHPYKQLQNKINFLMYQIFIFTKRFTTNLRSRKKSITSSLLSFFWLRFASPVLE